jgi:quercetin dioxygenase-like cupin family protein
MKPEIIEYEDYPKGWGHERWVVNKEKYCLKILSFKKGSSFSMHYHIEKEETWYVSKGSLRLSYYDLTNASRISEVIKTGTVVDIKPNIPHKLEALEDSEIIEVSTQHDSYRVEPGDSQK